MVKSEETEHFKYKFKLVLTDRIRTSKARAPGAGVRRALNIQLHMHALNCIVPLFNAFIT